MGSGEDLHGERLVSCLTAFRIWICRSQAHGAFERSATGALVGGMSVQSSWRKCKSQRILGKRANVGGIRSERWGIVDRWDRWGQTGTDLLYERDNRAPSVVSQVDDLFAHSGEKLQAPPHYYEIGGPAPRHPCKFHW